MESLALGISDEGRFGVMPEAELECSAGTWCSGGDELGDLSLSRAAIEGGGEIWRGF